MITDKEENIFKELIQSTGYDSAPKLMVKNVVNQLKSEEIKGLSSDYSLLPKWIWFSIIVLMICFSVFTFYQNPQSESIFLAVILQKLSFLTIDLSWFQGVQIGGMNKLIIVCLLPAVFLQFYFIKHYYERTI